MYGLVNKAVEGLVCQNFGVDKWKEIKEKAGVKQDVFISNNSYPDDMTYALVGAAHEVLGLPVKDILHAFGEYWVLETANKSYGPMLKGAGTNFVEFLKNLPNFHARVMLMYPNLKPPTFKVSDVKGDTLVLHYISHRPGLSDFVMGLISGLGKLYSTKVNVKHTNKKTEGAEHDEFHIQWSV
jgi:hypothetical protein